MNEDGELLFCPEQSMTRAVGAAFAEYRDPFAQINLDGKIRIGDHVRDSDQYEKGIYWVQFTRDIQRCSIESWPHDFNGDGVRVVARLLWGTIDTLVVHTTFHDRPMDIRFNVRIHCK